MILNNWSVAWYDYSLYEPPKPRLSGEVEYHERLRHGGRIVTSRVVAVEFGLNEASGKVGTFATTISGSTYELGEPDSKWVEFLKENSKYNPLEALEFFVNLEEK